MFNNMRIVLLNRLSFAYLSSPAVTVHCSLY